MTHAYLPLLFAFRIDYSTFNFPKLSIQHSLLDILPYILSLLWCWGFTVVSDWDYIILNNIRPRFIELMDVIFSEVRLLALCTTPDLKDQGLPFCMGLTLNISSLGDPTRNLYCAGDRNMQNFPQC
jgi:hypothetical protein